MKKHELNQMNKEQLENTLKELRRELIKMNTQISTGANPENPGKVRQVKRTIARILTLKQSKTMEGKKKNNE